MDVTKFGIEIGDSNEHPLKHQTPIVLAEFDMIIDGNDLNPSKQHRPIM
jgi:hypothetical protein